jgi:hypothetical protein
MSAAFLSEAFSNMLQKGFPDLAVENLPHLYGSLSPRTITNCFQSDGKHFQDAIVGIELRVPQGERLGAIDKISF